MVDAVKDEERPGRPSRQQVEEVLLLLREGGVGGEHDDGAVGAQERLAGGLGVVPEDGAEPRRVDEGGPRPEDLGRDPNLDPGDAPLVSRVALLGHELTSSHG